MIAALAAALALAGAPSSTPVTCQPDALIVNGQPAPAYVLGVTRWTAPPSIELRAAVCGGLLYASASPRERRLIVRLNPSVQLPELAGLGLLVTLHEATHAALHSLDECLVERAAMAGLPRLLALLEPADAARALTAATAADASFRPANGC